MDTFSLITKSRGLVNASRDMAEICRPLEKLGIKLFVYAKYFADMSAIALSNQAKWTEFYIQNFYALRYPQTMQFLNDIQGNLLISRELFPKVEAVADIDCAFNFGTGIVVVKEYADAKEMCYFFADTHNININNYFLNNVKILELFIDYFKEAAASLISSSRKSQLLVPQEYWKYLSPELKQALDFHHANQELLHELKRKKFNRHFNKKNIQLSVRQLECARWLVLGKTVEEISIIMGLSKHTINAHIKLMKNKFECYKTSELIYHIVKGGFLN